MRHWPSLVLCSALFISAAASAAEAAKETPQAKPAATAASASKPAAKPSGGSATAKPDAPAAGGGSGSGDLYTVGGGGTKVDPKTLAGWKAWRALACERCHGAEQEGLVGPPLTESLKKLTKEQFHDTLVKGRLEKGMPPFNTSKMVMDNWEGLYAYLKGRSDGKIKPGRLTGIDAK